MNNQQASTTRTTTFTITSTITAAVLLLVTLLSPSPASAEPADEWPHLVPFRQRGVTNMVAQPSGDNPFVDNVADGPTFGATDNGASSVRLSPGATSGKFRSIFGHLDPEGVVCIGIRARVDGTGEGTIDVTPVVAGKKVGVEAPARSVKDSEWRNLLFRFEPDVIGTEGEWFAAEIEIDSPDSAPVEITQVLALNDCATWATAKLLGYALGDGNFKPYSGNRRPSTLRLDAGGGETRPLVLDFVEHACAAGYAATDIKVKHGTATRSIGSCTDYAVASGSGADPRVLNFNYPFANTDAAFASFVTSASTTQRRAFISGLLPTEGSIWGVMIDQFKFGGYTCEELGSKLDAVLPLFTGIDAPPGVTADFPEAKRQGDECGGYTIKINRSLGCRLNADNGYDFAAISFYNPNAKKSAARIPNAVKVGPGSRPGEVLYSQPAACSPAD